MGAIERCISTANDGSQCTYTRASAEITSDRAQRTAHRLAQDAAVVTRDQDEAAREEQRVAAATVRDQDTADRVDFLADEHAKKDEVLTKRGRGHAGG